jgi:hypothetical protein
MNLIKFIKRKTSVLSIPDHKKKIDFAYKILSSEQTRFRNGSYYAVVKIDNIYFADKITIVVECSVKISKRKNGNKNIESWTRRRLELIRDHLSPKYFQRLKYLGATNFKLKLQAV